MNINNPMELVLVILGALAGAGVILALLIFVVFPLCRVVWRLVAHIFGFIGAEITDFLRIIGGVITAVLMVPLTLGSIVIGRWSSAAHFGRAISGEFGAVGSSLYRLVIGNPARLFCLTALTDGIEKRLPEVIAQAPGADKPNTRRAGQFEGYKIIGSLAGGGSGGKLFVAEPDAIKQAAFARSHQGQVTQVVIKTFSLKDGSSLPQIVRESRALEAAKKMGLVLDHELSDERFFYVMRYVPGESLGIVTQRLHAQGGGALQAPQWRALMGYATDLVSTLDQYHRGGLWHKDVKPDNIIVDGANAHLVDFGLVTPLRSGMTLTTHGTEYFRDPEMVRLALKGVKVHEVDGARFDLYAAGAVLFSMIENSFPAHGGLSHLTKPCPEALRWIVRRAMTDYDKRYPNAAAMLADLQVVRRAADAFALRPADLPSVMGGEQPALPTPPALEPMPAMPVARFTPANAGPTPVEVGRAASPALAAGLAGVAPRSRPRIRVTNWWSGRYETDHGPTVVSSDLSSGPAASIPGAIGDAAPFVARAHPAAQRSAVEQLSSARERARHARERAHDRIARRRGTRPQTPGTWPQRGVGMALLIAAVVPAALVGLVLTMGPKARVHSRGTSVVTLDPSAFMIERETNSSDGFRFQGIEPAPPTPPVPPMPGMTMNDHTYAHDFAREISEKISPEDAEKVLAVLNSIVDHGGELLPKIREASEQAGAPFQVRLKSVLARALDKAKNKDRTPPLPPAPASIAVEPIATVLFVNDAAMTLDEKTSQRIDDMIRAFQRRGIRALGSYPGNDASSDELERQRGFASQVRAARGLEPLDSPETQQALGDWVMHNEAVDGVVWVESSSPGDFKACLYGPTDLDLDEDSAGTRAWQAIREAVREPERSRKPGRR